MLPRTLVRGPVKTTPVELPEGRLVAAFERQMFASSNGGASWEKLGEPVPIKPVRTFTGTLTPGRSAALRRRRGPYRPQ